MKKLTALTVLILIVFAANAQYNENFAFWNTIFNPDNANAKLIKKTGYKTLTILAYEPDAEDTASTIFNAGYVKFNENGMRAYVSTAESGKDIPFAKYTYDKKGKVLKYSYSNGKNPEQTFEFEYDKKKGFKTIKYTGPANYKYDMEKSLLVATAEMDTQYYYFNKNGMPEKYVKVYREKGYAPGFYYADTTYYTYDKKGNLTSYKAIEVDKFGDTSFVETGAYQYKKKVLTSVTINKKDRGNDNMVQHEELHTYAISSKSGRLINYSLTIKNNYMMGGEKNTDTFFTDEIYTYGKDGFEISKSVSNNPGVVLVFEYRYSK